MRPHPDVNPNSRLPIFEQIKNLIQFSILSGDYCEGDQVPPVLTLAKDAGVNLNTVAKAYRDLEIVGILSTRRGTGCFVKKGAIESCRAILVEQIYERLRESLLEAKAAGVTRRDLNAFIRRCLADDSGPYKSQRPSRRRSARKR